MRIRVGKNSDPGSGINIQDPQHWSHQSQMGRNYGWAGYDHDKG